MTTSKELFLSILAMDSYNRGYGSDVDVNGRNIGSAKILVDSESAFLSPNSPPGTLSEAGKISFYAVAYDVSNVASLAGTNTVISYRGTDYLSLTDLGSDFFAGWSIGAGFTAQWTQAPYALDFYSKVTGVSYNTAAPGVMLPGHSLGGGLVGLVGSLYHLETYVYDAAPFELAALMASPPERRMAA